MNAPRIIAIVPAAGQSRRMGRTKQLLDVAGRPMLIGLLDTLRAAGVDRMIVVTTRSIASALRLDDSMQFTLVFNDSPDTQMIDSVRLGLNAAPPRDDVHGRADSPDGFLVCPADHPKLSAADVRACIDEFTRHPHDIIIAARGGRRGHPIIFPVALAAVVRSPACDRGLNGLPAELPERVRLVDCSSEGVTRDVDTPDDLQQK